MIDVLILKVEKVEPSNHWLMAAGHGWLANVTAGSCNVLIFECRQWILFKCWGFSHWTGCFHIIITSGCISVSLFSIVGEWGGGGLITGAFFLPFPNPHPYSPSPYLSPSPFTTWHTGCINYWSLFVIKIANNNVIWCVHLLSMTSRIVAFFWRGQ